MKPEAAQEQTEQSSRAAEQGSAGLGLALLSFASFAVLCCAVRSSYFVVRRLADALSLETEF